jgi:hypothetical protein
MIRQSEAVRELFQELGPDLEEIVTTSWFGGYVEGMTDMMKQTDGNEISDLLHFMLKEFDTPPEAC